MICDDFAVYIRAFCDREMIPLVAAEHFASCPLCQIKIRAYLAISNQLRRSPMFEMPFPNSASLWTKLTCRMIDYWHKLSVSIKSPNKLLHKHLMTSHSVRSR